MKSEEEVVPENNDANFPYKVYGLLCLCHLEKGIQYVGQTRISVQARLRGHKKAARSGKLMPSSNWIRAHGEENIVAADLGGCFTQEACDQSEIFYIQIYDTLVPRGKNVTLGGKGVVGYKFSEYSKTTRARNTRGEGSPSAKLDNQKVREIRALAQSGETNAAIARKYGIVKTSVANIKNGVTWSHIE